MENILNCVRGNTIYQKQILIFWEKKPKKPTTQNKNPDIELVQYNLEKLTVLLMLHYW